jgi:hypothetical protein
LPVALVVEAAIALAGLYLFLSGARLSSARKVWLCVLMACHPESPP